MELQGQRVLVTGSTAGIGQEAAKLFARHGATVIVTGRDPDRGAHTVAAIQAEGGSAEFVAADLGYIDSVRQLAAHAGAVDVLVNNAGTHTAGATLEQDVETFDETFNVDVRAPFFLAAAVLPAMIERGQGGIINVSSMAGFQPVPYAALYSATKSFLTTFSMALREELRKSGVKVVTVCPGRLRADTEDAEAQKNRQKVPGGEQRHEVVVDETLKKLDAGGGLVIPGRINRLTVRGQRLMSLNAVPKIVARLSKS